MKSIFNAIFISGTLLTSSVVFGQNAAPPKDATYLTKTQIEAVRNSPEKGDKDVVIVDIGKYNVGVGVTRHLSGEPASNAGYHTGVTEIDIVQSGSGTVTTGGTIPNGKLHEGSLPTGPNFVGEVQGGMPHHISAGDVVIIPAGVVHHWDSVEQAPLTILVVRCDAEHVLPSPYVHPAIK